MDGLKDSSDSGGGGKAQPAKSQPQLLAALVQAMLFCAIREGLEPNELLGRAGLTLSEIEPLYKSVPYTKVLALIREIDRQRPHINLGLMMGQKFVTARMGPLGYVLTSAPNFSRALRDFVKFQGLVNGGLIVWNVSRGPGTCVVKLTPDPELADIAWILEAPITMIITIARELAGHHVVPLQVSFRHAPRAGTEEHETFFGIPIRWNAPDNELVLSDTVLALPVQSANKGLYPQLLLNIDAQRDQAAQPSRAMEKVRLQIQRMLTRGTPRKEIVARAIGMSARTLFRRLAEAGTTFDAMVDRTRRELAIELLADSTIAISKVATLLGYSESSPFFRAFVRWFGFTPAEYRARLVRRS